MLMTSDLLIATLSSFNYFNRLKQSTGISYCDITRFNFNSIYSLISDKPCFIAIKHKTLKLVGYLFLCVYSLVFIILYIVYIWFPYNSGVYSIIKCSVCLHFLSISLLVNLGQINAGIKYVVKLFIKREKNSNMVCPALKKIN